jgi:glutamate synthase (NADPH/NADH) large chain
VIRDIYADMIKREGMTLLGWRDVPTDNSTLGESVKPTEPVHQQVFIGRGNKIQDESEFERRLYLLRKSISHAIYQRRERRLAGYYPVSISCRTVIYKGMFLADQLGTYYPDLSAETFESALALVHQHLVARPSLPHGGAQRRDQHAARQSQLDGGAPGLRVLAPLR